MVAVTGFARTDVTHMACVFRPVKQFAFDEERHNILISGNSVELTLYSRPSVARTLIGRLPRLFRTRS